MEGRYSRIINLWLLSILFIALLTELGCTARLIPFDVLSAVACNSARWWHAPLWLHAINSLLILFVLSLCAIVLFATDVARRRDGAGVIAAVLLSSHLSPIYLVVPFVPLVGAVFASLIPGGLLLQAKTSLDPRDRLRRFLHSERGDRILWFLLGLLVLYCFLNQWREAGRVMTHATDFGTFYDAAVALAKGNDPYGATSGGYFYPPAFAFYFRALTWLPKVGASLLWFSIKLALVISSLIAVHDFLGGRTMAGARRRWFIAGTVFVALRFLVADLQFGNVNDLVLWLGLTAVVLDLRGRSMGAGIASAAAISTKVVPAVFLIYFAVRGRMRVLLWTASWLVALNLFPFLFGARLMAKSYAAYFATGVVGKLGSRLSQPDNQSLWGALSRAFDLPLSQMRLVWLLCSLSLAGIASWVTFRARREDEISQAGAASLFFLVGLLVSPGSWVVHYSAVLLPLAYLLREAMANRSPAAAWASFLWVVFAAANMIFTFSGLTRAVVALSIEQSLFVAADCLLFFVIVVLNLRRRAIMS